MSLPRILIAGLRGGSGKTLLSVGLTAALRKRGLRVAPFKKGPDYIDAAWLSAAAGRPCRNLDLFFMSPQTIVRSFLASAAGADVAVVEGNRGLYDGVDAQGTYSTAELAKLLGIPVALAVDCTKSSRTVAATILGCQRLDEQVPVRGVILNRMASRRHQSVLREAVDQICGLPVLGAVVRTAQQIFPERHLGLVPPDEHGQLSDAIRQAAAVAEEYLDLEAILSLARQAPAIELQEAETEAEVSSVAHAPGPSAQTLPPPSQPRIGVFRDAAFQFYYPENLEALAREGGSLIEVSPLRERRLPDVDALYIGGGFPETAAAALTENKPFLDSLRRLIEQGLPVYAECGGAVFLGEKLVADGREYPMVGALPVVFHFHKRPQGHGYTILETVRDNPFYRVGDSLKGHEFHYTGIEPSATEGLSFAFRVRRGHGFDGKRDGLCHRNVLACYTHVHALGTAHWASSVVQAAARFQARV